MPRIALVIGGAGFVGSHLLKSLQTSGEYDALVSADISEPRFAVEGGGDDRYGDERHPLPENACPGRVKALRAR